MKKCVFMIMAAAAFVSCSNENEPIVENHGAEIALRSTAIDASGVTTRAPFEGEIGVDNKLIARVISAETTSFNTLYGNGTMTFNGTGAVTYDPASMEASANKTAYPSADASVYLFGLYPATGWGTPTTGVSEFTFTGKEDVMAAAKVDTKQSDATGSNYKTLTFQHLLTKLKVQLYADASAISKFGEIKSIRLVGVSNDNVVNKLSFNGSTSTNDALVVTPSAAVAGGLNFYSVAADGTYTETAFAGQAYELTTDPVLVAYSMVGAVTADKTADAYEYYIEVVSSHATKGTAKVPVELIGADSKNFNGSTAGRAFTMNVHFQATGEIKADAVVTEWIEEGEYTGGVEG